MYIFCRYLYVHVYVNMYICIFTYIYIYIYIQVHICIYIDIYIHTYICICTYTCTRLCTDTFVSSLFLFSRLRYYCAALLQSMRQKVAYETNAYLYFTSVILQITRKIAPHTAAFDPPFCASAQWRASAKRGGCQRGTSKGAQRDF